LKERAKLHEYNKRGMYSVYCNNKVVEIKQYQKFRAPEKQNAWYCVSPSA